MYHPYTMRTKKKVPSRKMPLINCAVPPVMPSLSKNLCCREIGRRDLGRLQFYLPMEIEENCAPGCTDQRSNASRDKAMRLTIPMRESGKRNTQGRVASGYVR